MDTRDKTTKIDIAPKPTDPHEPIHTATPPAHASTAGDTVEAAIVTIKHGDTEDALGDRKEDDGKKDGIRDSAPAAHPEEEAVSELTRCQRIGNFVTNMGSVTPKDRGDFLMTGILKVASGTLLLLTGEALNTQVTTPPTFYAPPTNSTTTQTTELSTGYALGNTTNWNMQYIGGIGIGLGLSDLMEVVKPGNVLSAITTGVINMVANPKNAFNDPKKTFLEGYDEVRSRPRSS